MEPLRVSTCWNASSSAHTKEHAPPKLTSGEPALKLYGKNTARLALSEAMTDGSRERSACRWLACRAEGRQV
eukprot:scaffold73849_cov71-Phaeocystis_antarctica.AAC.1